MYTFLRVLLAVWAVAYPVIACGPLLFGLNQGFGGAVVGGVFAIILSSALLGPWIVGLVLLGIGVYLTRPTGRWDRDGQARVVGGPDERPAPATTGLPGPRRADVQPGPFVDARLIAGVVLLGGGILAVVAVVAGWVR